MTDDFYILQEDFITIFKFTQSTDDAVEKWAKALDETIQTTPKATPFYILLDVSGDNVEFTQMARNQSKHIFTKHKKRKGYIAMVFEWRTSPYFARLFFSTIGKLGFQLNYFIQDAQAKAWLTQMYTESQ
ncbi:MAG: hypothetical protein WBC91_00375 [Phototrophicaceae bacterium]